MFDAMQNTIPPVIITIHKFVSSHPVPADQPTQTIIPYRIEAVKLTNPH